VSDALVPFVQLDLAGRLGLADGRYLARGGDGEAVLVVETLGAPAPSRRGLRRPKPRPATDPAPAELPITRVTAAAPDRLEDAAAARAWLAAMTADDERVRKELRAGLELVNRALHAHRTAAGDPHLPDASAQHALAVRIGWGTGDQVADSRWSEAVEIPAEARQRRLDEIRPQERVAAVLSDREEVHPAEHLALRAWADLEAGRLREAAIQMRAARESLDALPEAVDEAALREELRELRRELRRRSTESG
jgi:hypothetical protein